MYTNSANRVLQNEDLLAYLLFWVGEHESLPARLVCSQWNRVYRRHHDESMLVVSYVARFCVTQTILEWAVGEGMPLGAVPQHAAAAGNLGCLQFLRSQLPPPWSARVCSSAAANGHLRVLQWLHAQNVVVDCGTGACSAAARSGHLDVLQWLRTQDPPCPWNAQSCAAAAKSGHLQVLQWLRAQDPPCPWDSDTFASAVDGGQLHVLQWLSSQHPRCPACVFSCCRAAAKGHLEVLQWLHAQNPPLAWWDIIVQRDIAEAAVMDLLKWMRYHGRPYPDDEDACRRAAQYGESDMVCWLRTPLLYNPENKFYWNEWMVKVSARHDLGCQIGKYAEEPADPREDYNSLCRMVDNLLDVVRWLRADTESDDQQGGP